MAKCSSNKKDRLDRDESDEIMNSGSVITQNSKYKIHCINKIGEIEGHTSCEAGCKTTKYENVIPQLILSEQDDKIDGILLVINTVGGDVEAGLALAEIIAGMKKPSVSLVIGGGHSIGVPLAVSAKKTFIAKTATMTLHPVRSTGTLLGTPQTFEYFERMQKRIALFVAENSKISEERFMKLVMNTSELSTDIGSVLDGQKAVDAGLIDSIGGIHDAFRALYAIIKKSKSKK